MHRRERFRPTAPNHDKRLQRKDGTSVPKSAHRILQDSSKGTLPSRAYGLRLESFYSDSESLTQTILKRAFLSWYSIHIRSPDRTFRAIPDKSAPPPLMFLATALCANDFPLASRPDIRTARSACVRSSRRRSTMTVILQQAGLISWGGAGGFALVGTGIARSSQTSRHASECSRFHRCKHLPLFSLRSEDHLPKTLSSLRIRLPSMKPW
jgi:hypothetical protein